MDIPALSMVLSQGKIQQQASLSVMKKAMDNSQQANQLLNDMLRTNTQMMEQSVNPHLGGRINIKL